MFGELYKDVMARSRRLGIPHIPLEDAYVLQATAFATLTNVEGVALDLGAGVGFSTIWIVEAAKKLNRKVIAVESDEKLFQELKEVAEKGGFEAVKADVLGFLRGLEREVAFAFVDVPNELYPEVVVALSKKLAEGGCAVFHNAFIPSPPPEFFEALKDEGFEYTVVPTSLGLTVAVKKGEP